MIKMLLAVTAVVLSQIVAVNTVHAERIEMYISPLECTSDQVNDGITTQVILSPQACDEYLHPTSKPQNPNQPTAASNLQVGAPNTGVFTIPGDYVTFGIDILFFVIAIIGGLIIGLRVSRMNSKKYRKK